MVRRYTMVAAIFLVATFAAGCGVSGRPVAGEIDVRTLDVGRYQVSRHSYSQDPHGHGDMLEGIRMGEAVLPSFRIDPTLKYGRNSTIDTEDPKIARYLSSAERPILDAHNFIIGFGNAGSDQPKPGPGQTVVRNLVLRFPDATTAAQAARELEDADFRVAQDQNRKLVLPQYPDALIHYRPGVASAGAFLAHKDFVLAPMIERPTDNPDDLLAWVRKTFDAQLPALDKFQETPQAKLNSLSPDPQGMLARVLVSDRGKQTPGPSFASYGPTPQVASAPDQVARQRLVDETGLDVMAVTSEGVALRTRDAGTAQRLVEGLIEQRSPEYDPADAPGTPVPGVKCTVRSADADPAAGKKMRCYLAYKRYAARVDSNDEADLKQRIAAQYALLANSL